MTKRVLSSFWILIVFFIIFIISALAGCGGGGSPTGGGGGGGGTFDFAMAVQPAIVALTPGSSGSMTVSMSGTAASVSVNVSGLPSGVSATPAQFSLAPGGQQAITFTAAAAAPIASANLAVNGSAGTVTHSANASLVVNSAQKLPRSPFRTSYLRTDTQWDVSFLAFAPQRLILYHAPTRRFFSSSTFLNRVDVIDASTEQLVGEIPVPGAFTGDETPDHSAIYIATQVGDVYKIDPVAMKVLQRFPAVQIGPTGFAAYQVRVMADGRLALLGGQGGIPAVDGWTKLAIWNPADNSFFIAPRSGNSLGGTAFALTADRSKVLLGFNGSGGSLLLYDPVTDAQRIVATNFLGDGVHSILTSPDGAEVLVDASPGAIVKIFDANELFLVDQFQIGDGTGFFFLSLSLDGNTLYAADRNGGGNVLAYDWRTHQLKGWMPSMEFLDFLSGIYPDAIDETGLIAAESSHGITFLDAGALHAGAPTSSTSNSLLAPVVGPVSGGTRVQLGFGAFPATNVSAAFFGNQLGANVQPQPGGASVTSPAGNPGPVDVTGVLADGNLVLAPESFSYGPSIIDVATDSSTAEGGATATIFGYGFGAPHSGGQAAAGLQVQVNRAAASNLQYLPAAMDQVTFGEYPLPIEAISFTLPPVTAGSVADIKVTTSDGSATVTQALHYLPALRTFPLPGSVLVQGIYDPLRDVCYFSDATRVQVFSKAQGAWLAPIAMPAGATRLWGLSLSPDGSKLAVSDAGAQKIYVLNPDTPGVVSSFSTPAGVVDAPGGQPAGLAITDSGIVHYMVFYTGFTGSAGLHKLDTTTGTVTPFQSIAALDLGEDALTRVVLSNDNARLYLNVAGFVVDLDTATDTVITNPVIPASDFELTLSSNQTWMSATGWLMDTNLNPQSFLTLTDRQVASSTLVFGAKLSPDGSLLFQPLVDGIDVFDAKLGTLRTRIALPIALSANYDAMVADGKDNVLVAIAGANGDGGVAVIDLTSLPLPAPQPFSLLTEVLPPNLTTRVESARSGRAMGANASPATATTKRGRARHVVNDVIGKTGSRVLN
jgi:hypothetical protein